jgi:prolyl-tRNA editing enzyme YbaK/EbsC (Cys-tRNA(Pro) deacylase)
VSGPSERGAGLSDAARRVQEAISARGYDYQVIELAVPVRTAAEAAQQVGCEVGQIAKSLIFRAVQSGRGVLVTRAGEDRR